MKAPESEVSAVQRQEQALLALIEADRLQQNTQVLAAARSRAAAVHDQARADARAAVRATFAEQRQRRQQRLAAALARVATQRRLHEQQRSAALLQLAWQQLPGELAALWQRPDTRQAWVQQVLATARTHLPGGGWRIVCAADWPRDERQALAQALADAGPAPSIEADATIRAGLKVIAGGNVIDGTLAGLLADREAFEARLLRRLEDAA